MQNTWLIQGARIVDPERRVDEVRDLFIRDGHIAGADDPPGPDVPILEASGLVAVPGLIDVHVHYREPGNEEAETIESGSRAAARGGFTSVVTMPNTQPATDTPERIAWIRERAEACGLVRVLPSGCLSRGRRGEEPADLSGMARAGAAAFTDDGATVADDGVMARCMTLARSTGRPVMDHALDPALAGVGVMHEGPCSRKAGLPGIPSAAEVRMVARDIAICRAAGGRIHIQHVSAAASVSLIAGARKEGLPVSGEATPHHLALTDADVDPADANWKMNPPLRSEQDRQAIIRGVVEGSLDCFATDHAPHRAGDKARDFLSAPFGIIGLETAVGVTYTELVVRGLLSLPEWVRRWTRGPAAVLGLRPPTLAPGAPADIALLDLTSAWTVSRESFASRSRNTPFLGRALTGRAVVTLLQGRLTWNARA